MEVLYDYQIFQMQNYGGISRYFFELMNNAHDAGFEYNLSLCVSSNEYINQNSNISAAFYLPIKSNEKYYKYTNQVNKYYSIIKTRFSDYTVFHPTFFEDYYLRKIKKPYVITVYDLINERFPSYFVNNDVFINKKRLVMENASRIIAISENTKKDITELYDIDDSKIDVTYLAESLSDIRSRKIKMLPASYLLFVGKREGYKNFNRFYEAIKTTLFNEQDLYLVCAGGGDFSSQEYSMFVDDKIAHKIKHVVFRGNEELKFLYENATVFIFPSLYEGFGIPVLESFASGCLTCLSNTSSLQENGGKGALYFDPYSPDDIKNCVKYALSLDKISQYTKEGYKILKNYSWEKTAKNTYDVYRKCYE